MRNRHIIAFCCFLLLIAFSGCSSVPEQPETVSQTKTRAAEYTDYGNRYFDQALFDQALKFYAMALENNIAVDHKEGIILSRDSIGQTYLMMGLFTEADSALQAARELAVQIARKDLELRVLNSQGKLALNQGDTEKAGRLFNEALLLLESSDNPAANVQADIYHSIGALNKLTGDLQEARANLEQSIRINSRLDREEEIAGSYYMLASVFSKLEDFSTAREYLLSALSIDKKIENKLGIADDYFALGIVTEKMGKLDEAYLHFQTALDIYAVLNRTDSTIETLSFLTGIAEELGLMNEAEIYKNTLERIEGTLR
ncbi:tetratricopeptide repeat protein [Marispirochaeta sp.]|uniref:tetratricopeptide repeat protein n=1 Tax=Marispirochaeta sp. TaxID=2038653 RepID=UPI0029C7F72F|nr:tetratricopeptide repeat protein [Marispirochaeta sp.]